jgi:hypothetical protein
VGIATGVAALGAIFAHHVDPARPNPQGFVDGLNAILLVGALLALVAAVTSLFLIRRKDFVGAAVEEPVAAGRVVRSGA